MRCRLSNQQTKNAIKLKNAERTEKKRKPKQIFEHLTKENNNLVILPSFAVSPSLFTSQKKCETDL